MIEGKKRMVNKSKKEQDGYGICPVLSLYKITSIYYVVILLNHLQRLQHSHQKLNHLQRL